MRLRMSAALILLLSIEIQAPTLAATGTASSASTSSVHRTTGLEAAMERIAVGAKVLAAGDVNSEECDVSEEPGIVSADFNGDTESDFAVLLKLGESGKEVLWQGRTLKLTNYAFVILTSDDKDGLTIRQLERFEDYAPLPAFLSSQSAGQFEDRDSGKIVTTKYPGVALELCGKSASLYYVDQGEVRTLRLSD